MAGRHVRVRLPGQGLVASDVVQAHPGSRIACIEVARRGSALGPVVDHLALVEGVPDKAIAALLAAWHRTYQMQARTLGTPFALRLPLPILHVTTPGLAELLDAGLHGGEPLGHVLTDGSCDLWVACTDAEAAAGLVAALRRRLPASCGAVVSVGEPSAADRECWAALRLAHEVASDPPRAA